MSLQYTIFVLSQLKAQSTGRPTRAHRRIVPTGACGVPLAARSRPRSRDRLQPNAVKGWLVTRPTRHTSPRPVSVAVGVEDRLKLLFQQHRCRGLGGLPHRRALDPTPATAGPTIDVSGDSPTRTAPRSRESNLGHRYSRTRSVRCLWFSLSRPKTLAVSIGAAASTAN